jgi:hypothetical protein
MKEGKTVSSKRNLKAEDAYGLAQLCFATAMGLTSAIAAIFTTMLPLSVGLRYFWLAVCVVTFLLAIVAVALFFQRPITKLEGPSLSSLSKTHR